MISGYILNSYLLLFLLLSVYALDSW